MHIAITELKPVVSRTTCDCADPSATVTHSPAKTNNNVTAQTSQPETTQPSTAAGNRLLTATVPTSTTPQIVSRRSLMDLRAVTERDRRLPTMFAGAEEQTLVVSTLHRPSEVLVAAILPIVFGLAGGWRLARRTAIVGQIVLWALATVILVATAPQHGGDHSVGEALVIGSGLAVVSALTLTIGLRLARRNHD